MQLRLESIYSCHSKQCPDIHYPGGCPESPQSTERLIGAVSEVGAVFRGGGVCPVFIASKRQTDRIRLSARRSDGRVSVQTSSQLQRQKQFSDVHQAASFSAVLPSTLRHRIDSTARSLCLFVCVATTAFDTV